MLDSLAVVAQLVERDLAKVEVAGSSPVYRSRKPLLSRGFLRSDSALARGPRSEACAISTASGRSAMRSICAVLAAALHEQRSGAVVLPALHRAPGVDGDLDHVGLELAVVHHDEAPVGERAERVGAVQLTGDEAFDDLTLVEHDAERGSRGLRSAACCPAEPAERDAERVRVVDDRCVPAATAEEAGVEVEAAAAVAQAAAAAEAAVAEAEERRRLAAAEAAAAEVRPPGAGVAAAAAPGGGGGGGAPEEAVEEAVAEAAAAAEGVGAVVSSSSDWSLIVQSSSTCGADITAFPRRPWHERPSARDRSSKGSPSATSIARLAHLAQRLRDHIHRLVVTEPVDELEQLGLEEDETRAHPRVSARLRRSSVLPCG